MEKTKNEVMSKELTRRNKEVKKLCKFLITFYKLHVLDMENAVLKSENQLLKVEEISEFSNTNEDSLVEPEMNFKLEDYDGCL